MEPNRGPRRDQVSDREMVADLVVSMVVGTGVDPVTYRFSAGSCRVRWCSPMSTGPYTSRSDGVDDTWRHLATRSARGMLAGSTAVAEDYVP